MLQHLKIVVFLHPQWKHCKLFEKYCKFKISFIFAHSKINGPFVYRLGRQVFILVRGVRFPYGLQFLIKKKKQMANHKSALKRIRSNEAKRLRNKYQHKTTRNAIKKLRELKIRKMLKHYFLQLFL